MQTFGAKIRPFVNRELAAAAAAIDPAEQFRHFERAHVLGQASTLQHVRVHWLMLRWAIRQANCREAVGQVLRLAGAATKTAFGLVPIGNTGGANVSPFRRMPLDDELSKYIEKARKKY